MEQSGAAAGTMLCEGSWSAYGVQLLWQCWVWLVGAQYRVRLLLQCCVKSHEARHGAVAVAMLCEGSWSTYGVQLLLQCGVWLVGAQYRVQLLLQCCVKSHEARHGAVAVAVMGMAYRCTILGAVLRQCCVKTRTGVRQDTLLW